MIATSKKGLIAMLLGAAHGFSAATYSHPGGRQAQKIGLPGKAKRKAGRKAQRDARKVQRRNRK